MKTGSIRSGQAQLSKLSKQVLKQLSEIPIESYPADATQYTSCLKELERLETECHQESSG